MLTLPDQIGSTLTGGINHLDGRAVYALDGEIDFSCANAMFTRVLEVADATEGEIVLDLAGVQYIDSTAVTALVALTHELEPVGQPVRLTRTSPQVRDYLETLGLLDFFKADDGSADPVR